MVELIEGDGRRDEGNRALQPDVLAGYVQLAFDAAVLALVVAIVVKFVLVIQDDVRCKVQERLAENLQLVADCRRSYEVNECLPGMRVPALEESCDKWFHCMNQNVERLKYGTGSGALWAKTMGEILNSFVEPISMRSAFLMLFVVCAIVMVTNVAIGSYRVYYYNGSLRQGPQR